MKKKNLSLMTLFMLTATLVGGCSCGKQSDENVSNIVIKVGDKEYSAKELYNQLLSTGTGANEAFAKVLRLVVESSMKTTDNMKTSADLAVETFEEEVSNNAITNGISKDEARKTLLEERGYSSVDEMKSTMIYEQKLTRLTEQYWEENKTNYYNQYVEGRLPYLVRQTLVMIDDNASANKIGNNVNVSQPEAKKLYDVIKRFENGDPFRYVANEESDDTGSTGNGGAYYMDNTYGSLYVDEYVYGTYAFDAYTTKVTEGEETKYVYGANQTKLSKLKGLTDTENFSKYYQNGFNFVDMSIVNMLGEVYNQTTSAEKDFFTIPAVNKIIGENDEISYSDTNVSNLNAEQNFYARSIIFNRAFNKPGVSVIGYNTKAEAEAAGAKNVVELKLSDTESKYILTDENKNPIFFVAARGGSNAVWIHFLTINVSALDDLENAKKFFSLTPDKEDNYTSYIELMNVSGTDSSQRTLVNELEGYIKSYVTGGTLDKEGDSNILKYDMVNHYINKNNISYLNTELKTAIETYIANKRKLTEVNLDNTLSETWDVHTDKLATNMSDFIQNGVKPYECGVWVDSELASADNVYQALSTSDHLCRYVYGEGYQVKLSYFYTTNSGSSYTEVRDGKTDNIVYFNSTVNYKEYVTIDSSNKTVVLPIPSTKDGYEFEGWYTDRKLTNKVTSIDLSESRMTNNTIFFAKYRTIGATTITYNYEYENGEAVNNSIAINNSNSKSGNYVEGGTNSISLDLDSITSDYVTPIKFLDEQGNELSAVELTAQGSDVTVRVVVKPNKTNIEYKFVDDSGVETTIANENTNAEELTYSLTGNNEYAIDLTKFVWVDEDNLEAKSVKIARGEEPKFADAVEGTTITLADTDMGQNITIYVVVGGK